MVALLKDGKVIGYPQPQKSNEWYTPSKYVEAARSVMNGIDLDPASCAAANQIVKATRYYTKQENGLSKEWHGNVWLNPPYGKIYGNVSSLGLFLKLLVKEYEAGRVSQAIVLTPSDCDEKWFQPLWNYPICFADHAIFFYRPNEPKIKHHLGSIFVYLGYNEQKFVEVFSQFGRIARAIDTPPKEVVSRGLWEVAEW